MIYFSMSKSYCGDCNLDVETIKQETSNDTKWLCPNCSKNIPSLSSELFY